MCRRCFRHLNPFKLSKRATPNTQLTINRICNANLSDNLIYNILEEQSKISDKIISFVPLVTLEVSEALKFYSTREEKVSIAAWQIAQMKRKCWNTEIFYCREVEKFSLTQANMPIDGLLDSAGQI